MFKEKKITSGVSVGQKLKNARRRKKYSLEYVEKKTKIRVKYLQAIESDNFSHLPSVVYLKGFLRTYSKFLNLDPVKIIDQFKKENFHSEQISPNIINKKSVRFRNWVISPKILIISVITLAVVAFGIFLILQVSGFISPPELVIYSPESDGTTESREISVIGKTETGSEISINDQIVATDADGNFNETVFLKNGTNLIQIKAKNKAGKENIKTFNFFANLPQIASNQNTSNNIKSKTPEEINLKLQIGPNASWIKIITDSKTVYQGIMIANSEQIFTAKKEIILSTGNAGSTHVFLNNVDKGTLGEENEVKKNVTYKISDIIE